jgi:uncharacterized radical SAM superfamily protein
MIGRMTTARPLQHYDHRLRELVQRNRTLKIATDLGVPRSTARTWLRAAPTVVVSLDVADLTDRELRQEVLKLRRWVQKRAALLRAIFTNILEFRARVPVTSGGTGSCEKAVLTARGTSRRR